MVDCTGYFVDEAEEYRTFAVATNFIYSGLKVLARKFISMSVDQQLAITRSTTQR
jgi:hypothetical protein